MTILLEITKTKRFFGANQNWFRYDEELHRFDTVADAKAFVRETYGTHKRAPIYVDTQSRGTIQTGWCISAKDDDGYLQDWCSLSEVLSETERTARAIDVKAKAVQV